ncbi:MAG: dihydropteroate synthase [Gammaproteobacteria bacterium]|nr:dihydropteroate synthase [Gammaproteobacteria bacterium]
MQSKSEELYVQCGGGHTLPVTRPIIMGILNVTPDSFSDGGRFVDAEYALRHARMMASEGAALIDVGGESTRPGAMAVSADDELARVLPVVRSLADGGLCVSVDTSKPEVMRAAADAGAAMINDVRALREPGALAAAASTDLAVCLMHMQGEPRTMQVAPRYDDVVSEVCEFLLDRARACEEAGIDRRRIVLDPGFGFGKSLEHNLSLLAGLERIVACGYVVLVGLSRKSMLQALTGRAVDDRLAGSITLAVMSALSGAHIIRVHDVAATRDALAVVSALKEAQARSKPPQEQ